MKSHRGVSLTVAGVLLLANSGIVAASPAASSDAVPVKSHSVLAPVGALFGNADFNNAPPLLWAIVQNRLDAAKELIREGSSATARYRHTPYLAIAAGLKTCSPKMLDLLMDHSADPNGKYINLAKIGTPYYTHYVPLAEAASSGSMACVSTLLRHGANPNGFELEGGVTVLGAAASSEYCSRGLIDLLVKEGAQPDFVPTLDDLPKPVRQSQLKQWGKLALFARRPSLALAAGYDHLACARALIKNGAKVNETAPDGHTSLMEAVGDGKSPAVTAFLLHAGVDVNARSKKGATALFMVAGKYTLGSPCMPCARLLVKAGADVNAVDDSGNSVMIDAASSKDALPFVRLLVSSGATVNYRNPKTGMTALKAARAAGDNKIASYLMAHGAKPQR